MNRVLVPWIGAPGDQLRVPAAESHHLLHVQRVARGRLVEVTDGAGRSASAVLADVIGDEAVLQIVEVLVARPSPARTILLGLPKAPAAEDAITLGTEAGATRFLLVEADRTPPGRPRPDRLERVLRAAVTQCGRPDLPTVTGPLPLSAALAEVGDGARWLAAPGDSPATPDGPSPDGPATIAIGPEGGWSPAEVAALQSAGFAPLTVGPWILRTPTAVAAALGALWPRGR